MPRVSTTDGAVDLESLAAADPDLVPGAVEEVLRWVTPLNNFFRRALADDRIGGQPVERGDRIILLYPSANRDEDLFENGEDFIVYRDKNPHQAFGNGPHFCQGTHVARRAVGAVMLPMLFERFPDLRLAGPARFGGLRSISRPRTEVISP